MGSLSYHCLLLYVLYVLSNCDASFNFPARLSVAKLSPRAEKRTICGKKGIDYTSPSVEDIQKGDLIKEIFELTGHTGGMKGGWKKVKDKQGAKVWRRKVDWTPWMQIRTHGIVEASPDFMLELLLDNSRVGEYDSLFDGIDVVERPDDHTVVRHMLYKAIWPTSPRDFITYTTHNHLVKGKKNSGWVIASKSVVHPARPATRKRCRGTIYHFGYTLKPAPLADGRTGTEVRMCAHMDLAGGMPASIINFLSSSQPLGVMHRLQEIAVRAGGGGGGGGKPRPVAAAAAQSGAAGPLAAFAAPSWKACRKHLLDNRCVWHC